MNIDYSMQTRILPNKVSFFFEKITMFEFINYLPIPEFQERLSSLFHVFQTSVLVQIPKINKRNWITKKLSIHVIKTNLSDIPILMHFWIK